MRKCSKKKTAQHFEIMRSCTEETPDFNNNDRICLKSVCYALGTVL